MRLTRKLLLFASLSIFSSATSVKYYDTGAQISGAEPSVSFPRIAYRDLSNSTPPADITQPSYIILSSASAEIVSFRAVAPKNYRQEPRHGSSLFSALH